MPSGTFSLFPSANDTELEQKALAARATATRRRSSQCNTLSSQARSPVDSQSELSSATPSHSLSSSIQITQDLITSKQLVLPATSNGESSQAAMRTSVDRPFSPDSVAAKSMRSSSPTLVASHRNSTATMKPRKKAAPSEISVADPSAIRSMFPTYDPQRDLQEQYYLPSQASPTNIPWEQVCKAPYSPDFPPQDNKKATDEGVGGRTPLLFTAPKNATTSLYTPEIELPALWELSNGRANAIARTQSYRLQMRQREKPSEKLSLKNKRRKPAEPLLTFGPSPSAPFLSVLSDSCEGERPTEEKVTKQRIRIRKHNLSRFDPRTDHYGDSSVLVSDVTLDFTSPEDSSHGGAEDMKKDPLEDIVVSKVTPHKAVLHALSLAGTSSTAAHLASVDPGAYSVAAANLAERAMTAAKEAHTCSLLFTNVPGTRQRGYALKHPTLGLFRILIAGDARLPPETEHETPLSPKDQPVKIKKPGTIKIMAPLTEKQLYDFSVRSPRSSNFQKPGPELASIDMETCTLSLHGAEISDLDNQYILDTIVSALISVVIAETTSPRLSHLMSFDAPPTKATANMALVPTAKYKYFPLIKTRKQKKIGRRERTAAEMEENLSVAMGALVFVLGAAVDGLMTLGEKAKEAQK